MGAAPRSWPLPRSTVTVHGAEAPRPSWLRLIRKPIRRTNHGAAGQRLASEFYISEDDATELVLGYGSETAVRKLLTEACWRGELERREAA